MTEPRNIAGAFWAVVLFAVVALGASGACRRGQCMKACAPHAGDLGPGGACICDMRTRVVDP